MEGSHCQLRSWFSDGLRRYDSCRGSYLDSLSIRKIAPIALRTDTNPRLTGQHAPDAEKPDAPSAGCLAYPARETLRLSADTLNGQGRHAAA